MVMDVFAEIRNGFECFCKCNIFVFQIWVNKEKLCSVLVFGNVCFNIVVRINHDNVASRGAVGRTHTIVRLQTRIRRKDGKENFGGFEYVLDGFLQRDFVLWVFMCLVNFIVSFYLVSFFCVSFPATTPRATTPHVSLFRLPRRGLPRSIYTPGLSRLYHHCTAITPVYIYPGYHAIV